MTRADNDAESLKKKTVVNGQKNGCESSEFFRIGKKISINHA